MLSHTVGNCDGEQAAIRKSRNADARHAVGDADGGQAGAYFKSQIINCQHAIWNNN